MPTKQFFVFIGTVVFCAFLFAAPGLYKLHKTISEEESTYFVPCSPGKLISKDVTVGVTFTFLTTNEKQPKHMRDYNEDARKVYIVADVTNTMNKAVEIRSIGLRLAQENVDVFTQSLMGYSAKPYILNPHEKKRLQQAVYMTRGIVGWLTNRSLEPFIEGEALFVETLQQ